MAAIVTKGIVVNVSDMIDLAIGTPEVGVVDFNMLQTVLHCLAQQLRILGKHVEIRGSMSSIPTARENVQTVAISEFVVETGEKSPDDKQYKEVKNLYRPSAPENSILVVERIKKSESPRRATTGAPSGTPGAGAADGPAGGTSSDNAGQKSKPITETDTAGKASHRLSLVTKSKFNVLEVQVQDLQKRVYGAVPANEEILGEVRSQTNMKAITDMWTNMNVSSRLDAAERGIAKLSSLVEDLISLSPDFQRKVSEVSMGQTTKEGRPSTIPSSGLPTPGLAAIGALPVESTSGKDGVLSSEVMVPTIVPGSSPQHKDIVAIYDHMNRLQKDISSLANTFYATMEDAGIQVPTTVTVLDENTTPSTYEDGATEPYGEPIGTAGTESEVGNRVDQRKVRIVNRHTTDGFSGIEAAFVNKLDDVEKRLKQCCEDVSLNYRGLLDHMTSVQDQVDLLAKQCWNADSEANKLTPDLVKDPQGLMQLFATVEEMKTELANITETAQNLKAEKESRQSKFDTIIEQIELLKVIKMDREDIAEALAEKADLRALARKVSHDQFDMACEDLSRGLEQAIEKLTMQEAMWQQALDDVQREIATKLDKMELSPVKEYFYNKLKQLQENLKHIAAMRRDIEAAGAKRKLLRDVNCISCDAEAVMSMEPPKIAGLKPMPAHTSMKPYLTYELDTIRKTQAANVPQRNMHDWETIEKQMGQSKTTQQLRPDKGKQLCNRYCGGSHTVTTPAQRVSRQSHFIKQWGPDVLPLSSGLAAGDDGKMYKVTNLESANVGPGGSVDACTPRKEAKKPELPPRSPPHPIIISAECRCLAGDGHQQSDYQQPPQGDKV